MSSSVGQCCREVLGAAGLDDDLLDYVCSTLADGGDGSMGLSPDIERLDVDELVISMLY